MIKKSISISIIISLFILSVPSLADVYHEIGTHYEVEAEDLNYSSSLQQVYSEDASGQYALLRTGTLNYNSSENDIVFNFNIINEGRYILYLKLKTSGSYITYYTKIDNTGVKSSFMSNVPTGSFIDFPVDSYYLKQGNHTIAFTYRHCGYYIDKLILTKIGHEDCFSNGSFDYTTVSNNSYNLSYDLPLVLANNIHPRLIINHEKINDIKNNLTNEQNINIYQRLLEDSYRNYESCILNTTISNNKNNDYLSYIEANAFLYALYKNPQNAQKAVQGIKDYLSTFYAKYNTVAAESREACNLVFRASIVYDWCHDYLTVEDKNFIINECLLLFAASEHGRDGIFAMNAFNSDHGEEYVLIKNMLGFAIAVFDEFPHMFNNVYKRIREEFIPSRNFRYENSDYNQQGDNYGIFRSGADSFLKLLLYNLGQEDLITDNQRMQAYQLMYRRNPNGDFMRDGDCYTFPILGGYNGLTGNSIAFIQSVLEQDEYLKHEYYKIAGNSKTSNMTDSGISDAMFLTLNDVSVLPKQKDGLPLSKYFGDKSGIMVARTGWDDGINSNTMTVSMKISERNMGGHGHSDSGHFYIYYKAPLAVDSGVYEPTSGDRNAHLNNYYRQTIAHNSILIGGNGQRRVSGIATYEQMSTLSEYGEVLGYDFGENLNTPDYTYLKGDLTEAYNEVAEEYTRSFMFFNFFDEVYPGALIVFDKVNSTNANDKKTYLLHSQNDPEITGNKIIIKNSTQYGYNGKLINETLLPNTDLNFNKISGYIVDGVDYTVGKASTSGIGDESGNYRVEISKNNPSKTEYMLNVLQVSENDDNIEPLTSSLLETSNHYGVKIKNRVAFFSKDRNRSTNDVEFNVAGSENIKFTVCDLTEGTWQVYKENILYDTINVSDNGGVGVFEGIGGNYKLTYLNTNYIIKDLNILNNTIEKDDYIKVYCNNGTNTSSNYKFLKNKPIMLNNEIMVPLEEIAEEFLATVTIDNGNLRVNKDNNELIIYPNSKIVRFNNEYFASIEASFFENGVWYVSSSCLNQVLKFNCDYNSISNILYLIESSEQISNLSEVCTVDVVKSGNGNVSNLGKNLVAKGDTFKISAYANTGSVIKSISYNGINVVLNANNEYETPTITTDSLISIEFEDISDPKLLIYPVAFLDEISITSFSKIYFSQIADEYGMIYHAFNPYPEFTTKGAKIYPSDPLLLNTAFGIKLEDKKRLLPDDYYMRAYAKIGENIYYSDSSVRVNKEGYEYSKDNLLKSLSVCAADNSSVYELSFDKSELEYDVPVKSLSDLPNVIYEVNDSKATVDIEYATTNNPTTKIIVTAENGAVKEYKINFKIFNTRIFKSVAKPLVDIGIGSNYASNDYSDLNYVLQGGTYSNPTTHSSSVMLIKFDISGFNEAVDNAYYFSNILVKANCIYTIYDVNSEDIDFNLLTYGDLNNIKGNAIKEIYMKRVNDQDGLPKYFNHYINLTEYINKKIENNETSATFILSVNRTNYLTPWECIVINTSDLTNYEESLYINN